MTTLPPGVVRTPRSRFADLPEWGFEPSYLRLQSLPGIEGSMRIHTVDHRADGADDRPVLMLHGEPSWSYLYRRMLGPIGLRHRALALDFVGFGRSDKLTDVGAYTYDLHRQTLVRVIEALDLRDVTLVVQDWGGLVGLPVAALDVPDRIGRLVVMNTFLPTGDEAPSPAFWAWKQSVGVLRQRLPIGALMTLALPKSQAPFVRGYTAPFPSARYKAGAAAWPLLVPTSPGGPVSDVMREARAALATWDKPCQLIWSPQDPILGGMAHFFERLIPTAGPAIEVRGGHFLQDKSGAEIAHHVLAFMNEG